jgi:transposase
MHPLGVDAHKWVHEAVALDQAGREVARRRVPNAAVGRQDLRAWATGLGGEDAPRRWGIEGVWGYGRGVAQHLVAAGEAVYALRPRWTAEARKRAPKPDKSDVRDALVVARLVLQDAAASPRSLQFRRRPELETLRGCIRAARP